MRPRLLSIARRFLLGASVVPGLLSAQRARLLPSPASGGAEVIHESWNMADGLPVNAINYLIQSKDGYIWAATFDGLVRFDGVRFTVFNSENSPRLPSNRIIRIAEAPDGALWLTTEQGHLVRRHGGRFTFVSPARTLPEQDLAFEPDGSVWVTTTSGLARVAGDSMVRVRPDLVPDSGAVVLRRRDGSILVAPRRGGLLRLRPNGTSPPTVFSVAEDSVLARTRILALHEEPNGTLWAAATGTVWTATNAWQKVPISRIGEVSYPIRFLPGRRSRGVLLYSAARGGLSQSTAGGFISVMDTARRLDSFDGPGLYAITTDDEAIWHGRLSTLMRNGVPFADLSIGEAAGGLTSITAVLRDREGSVWVGTFAAGLHRLKPTTVRTVSEREGLANRNVYGTYVDSKDRVWVGSIYSGASIIDGATGRVIGRNPPLPSSARVFHEGRDGTMWVGGGGALSGLFKCAPAALLACRPEHPPGAITEVYALFEDADRRLWIGAANGLLRHEQGRLFALDSATGAPQVPVRAFASAPDGSIWMGTNGAGLVRYREGVFTPVTAVDGLPSDLVRALLVDADGYLWVGTEGRGLARLDTRAWDGSFNRKSPPRIDTIATRHGLYDSGIHQILLDDMDRLWMSSNRGIFWISRRDAIDVSDRKRQRVRSTVYTDRDGMRNREANGGFHPSGAKTADGRLWFPTQDGVVILDPRNVASTGSPPPLVIEEVIAGDSVITPVNGRVRIAPNRRDIRVDFTALTFLEPGNVNFRYRLTNYSRDWVENATRRSAFFTQLPPGEYTFEVQASAVPGDWQGEGARIVVEVVPRLYETAWFRGIIGAALLTLLVAFFWGRSRAAVTRARELEQLVTERTLTLRDRERQLEQQNHQLEVQASELQQLDQARSRFFANVSHELRTPLTLMIAPLDRLRDQQQVNAQGHQWLDLAQRNARRLLELVNQLLDVAKLEAGAMRLSPRRFDICGQVRGTVESFRPTAERKQLQLLVDTPTQCHVTLDSDAVEKIVGNLLSNAVKFTPPEGQISLALRRDPTSIMLSVSNTGPAIPPAQLALVFERFYQVDESNTTVQPGTGIGLSLVKELVELQGGSVHATSTESATTFTVQLPVPEADERDARSADAWQNSGPIRIDSASQRDDRELDVPTILVVDDNEDMRAFVRDHFADRFRVIEAADGLKALSLAKSQLPDVIVSDVMMPRLDGRELVRRLRSDPDTDYLAIILLTAQAENEQRISGLETGADDYLGKPFEMRELDVRVRNLLAARRRLQVRYGTAGASNGPAHDTDGPTLGGTAVVSVSAASATTISLPAGDASLSKDERAYRERVLATIHARLGDADFGVTELAHEMAQDRSHLFRRVRLVTGLSPSDLLRRLRVEEGARLLLASSGSVADVAFSVGFRSVSHFFRCFHERYGVTPSEYRVSGAGVSVQGGP